LTSQLDDAVAQQFEGNFIDAADIQRAGQIELTIEAVIPPGTETDATGKTIDKPILAFKGARKRWILNKINARCLAILHGTKASGWIGKPVTLTVRWLQSAFGQQNVPTIRAKLPQSKLTFAMRKHYGQDHPFGEREA